MKGRVAPAALAVAGLLLAGLGAGSAARAASSHGPTLEVSLIEARVSDEVRASDAGPSVDPQLKDLSPVALQQAPFTRYNAYRLLQRQPFPLAAGKPILLPLPNGRTLQATLTGVSATSPDGGPVEKRYQLEAQIIAAADSGSAAFLRSLQVTVSANEPFFVGGQSYKGGTMFIELNVRP